MEGKLFVANWKMHKTRGDARKFVSAFVPLVRKRANRSIVICPSFTSLETVQKALVRNAGFKNRIFLGAQDVFWESGGAYTGEISIPQLLDLGCVYVILGHSERRQYFGEDDSSVRKKTTAALRNGLIPIVCVGENLSQRKTGKTLAVLRRQLRGCLDRIPAQELNRVIIAYEPIWAIGTGQQPTVSEIEDAHETVRRFGKVHTVLYGGSVTPTNVEKIAASKQVEGFLVGGASLDPAIFAEIVNI